MRDTVQGDDIVTIGKLDAAMMAEPVTIAYGAKRKDMAWKNKAMTFGDLVGDLTKFEESNSKDGRALLQGATITPKAAPNRAPPGVQRLAKNMEYNELLMIDDDTGSPLAEMVEKIQAKGLFALIWTTHSHGKDATAVNEDKLHEWMKKNDRTGKPTAADVADYLMKEKGTRSEVFFDAKLEDRTHIEGGVHYVLRHRPMARRRIMFRLAKRYVFADREGLRHSEAIADWAARYAAVAESIGLAYDDTCKDPSRLMYTPRAPIGARIGDGPMDHGAIIINGKPLDLDAVKVSEKTAPAKRPVGRPKGSGKRGGDFATANLVRFLADCGASFDIVKWVDDKSPDDILAREGDKAKVRCPNTGAHSNPGDDTGFWIESGEGREAGFQAQCSHNSCKAQCQGANGKGDRAFFLNLLCQKYKVEDAEALLPWCSDDARAAWEARGALFTVDGDTGEVTFNRVPTKQEQHESGYPFVWKNWGFDIQYEVAAGLLMEANATNPQLFTRSDGTYARLIEADGQLKLEHLNGDAWSAELHRRMQCRIFKRAAQGGPPVNEVVPLSKDLQQRIRGTADMPLPLLESFIRTPVFGPSGELRTERGYQADLLAYLDPRGQFDVPSAAPTADEVREAAGIIEEAFADFPFSDAFEGAEPLPYKVGAPEAGTGYRETNKARGVASRWNTYAALLHTQMRHLMPKGTGAPGFHLDKNSAGEGAGLLMSTLNIIANGATMPIRVFTGREEFEKSITTSLASGDSIIGIDNISGIIDSGPLAAMHTAGVWKVREFRSNTREVSIKTSAQWIFAGNNFGFSNELTQRMIPIRIDSGYEDPAAEREADPVAFFRHVDQEAWLQANRRRLVWALHTWVAHWFASGKPPGTVRHPRFPAYSQMIGGVLELVARTCGVTCHFLGNLKAYREAGDDEANLGTTWMQACFTLYGYQAMTASDMVKAGKNRVTGKVELELGVDLDRDGELMNARKAHAVIKNLVLRKPFRLDLSKWDETPSGPVRLVKSRQANPTEYRFVFVKEAPQNAQASA